MEIPEEMLRFNYLNAITTIWGHSSAGRAPAWHEVIKNIDIA